MKPGLIALLSAAVLAGCRTEGAPPPEARDIVAAPVTVVTVGGDASVDAFLTR